MKREVFQILAVLLPEQLLSLSLSPSLVFSAEIEGCAGQKQREEQLRPASLFLSLLLSFSEDDNDE